MTKLNWLRVFWPWALREKPEVGATYEFVTNDPFHPQLPIVVIDCRDGWVEYRIGQSAAYSLPLRSFNFCYAKVASK